MSTDLPGTKRGLYKRRVYDRDKHCGAPKDRSMEWFDARVAKYDKEISELEDLAQTRELKRAESIRIHKKQRMRALAMVEREKIVTYGPDDRPCMWPKGYETSHPGVGYCKTHCECKGRKDFHLGSAFHDSRRKIENKLRAKMDKMEAAQMDLDDSAPELLILKAKIQMFIDEKQDFEPETIKSLTLLQENIRKTIETRQNKKFQTMLSFETFNLIMYRLGEVVSKHIQDQELLDKIVADWDRISVEASASKLKQIQAKMTDPT